MGRTWWTTSSNSSRGPRAHADRAIASREEPVKFRKSVVMRGRWRLVDGEDLYDLQSDPGQTKPLPTAENEASSNRMLGDYHAWWNDMKIDPNQYSNI